MDIKTALPSLGDALHEIAAVNQAMESELAVAYAAFNRDDLPLLASTLSQVHRQFQCNTTAIFAAQMAVRALREKQETIK